MNPGPWFPDHDRRRDNEPLDSEYGEDDEGSFADVYNSFTFGSGRGRKKKRKRDDEPPPEQQRPPEGEDSRAEQRERAREVFRTPPPQASPSDSERSASDLPVQGQAGHGYPVPGLPVPGQPGGEQVPGQQIPAQQGPAVDFGGPGQEQLDPEAPENEYTVASSIRSYTWTGGRTKSNHQLEMETLVSTSETYRPGTLVRMEHQSIAEMCQHPRSVAEVGAHLSVPIGVARVLLADMAELGLITVHQTVSESGSAPHLMLMERVLSGLRRL